MGRPIEKCRECGCPQTDYWRGIELHFKKCKVFKRKTVGLTMSKSLQTREYFKDVIGDCKDELQIDKTNIKLLNDCIKDTCPNDMYECRL